MEGVMCKDEGHEHESLVRRFSSDCMLRGMTKESIERYVSSVNEFLRFLRRINANVLQVGKNELRGFVEYLRSEHMSQKTLENYFSAISCFYEFLSFEGYVASNPVLAVRRRYLRVYKDGGNPFSRRVLSVEEMARFINTILDPRDKAIVTLLAKTGIRRGELIRIDVDDINWEEQSITLKRTPKRTNRIVFFDDECARILKRWLRVKEEMGFGDRKPLFVTAYGNRIDRNTVYSAVARWAERAGLHARDSKPEERISPHALRHWFTTWLRRNGMPREFIQELRGDRRREAIDIYDHIDREELRRAYLTYIPRLGI